MGLAGDVLVFMADFEPMCALQVCIEILQVSAIESRPRDGHFRFSSQVPQHRASSGPLRLLRWSRCDWVTLLKEVDEVVAKLHFMVLTVFAQEQPVYIGLKVEDTFKVGHYRYCSGFGVRVVDMRVETQPICTNSSQIELVAGGLRMLKNFLTGVSSWTKQV